MDHQLHAAGFVEETLEHHRVLGRQAAERGMRRGQILDQLAHGRLADAELIHQPAQGAIARRVGRQVCGDFRPKARHRHGQLVAAARRLAQPERNCGWQAMRILDPDDTALDPQDAVRGVAELEDVAGHALDREILVHGADRLVLGLEDDAVVGGVRDRTARGQPGQARAPPSTQYTIDAVIVDQSPAPAATGAEALR